MIKNDININDFLIFLNQKYDIKNYKTELKLIISNQLNIESSKYYLKDFKINKYQAKIIIKKIKKILKGYPLGYVLNEVFFLNQKFYINKNVLNPRPETEQLVFEASAIINKYLKNKSKIVFDVCCGSLVISESLLNKLENIKLIIASDISKKAIKVAKKNNHHPTKIKIIKSNLINYHIKHKLKCNVLICNPPYISNKIKLANAVKKEPKIALFAKDNGLYFYKQIIKQSKFIFFKKGILIFEIGFDQKDAIFTIIKKYLPNKLYECKKDFSNKNRFIYIYI